MNSIFHFLDDLFFPTQCMLCHREGVMLCAACKLTFPMAPLLCPFCSAVTGGETCNRCKKSRSLSGVISLFDYEHPGVQKMIATIKYRGLFSLVDTLAPDMYDQIVAYPDFTNESAILVPAPLRKQSFLERGFNQATYIARTLQQVTNIPLRNILYFKNTVQAQHTRAMEKRWENTTNRVRVTRFAKDVKHAIVVDDLLTTGATLESCAQALKRNGVQHIYGFTLARQKKFTT